MRPDLAIEVAQRTGHLEDERPLRRDPVGIGAQRHARLRCRLSRDVSEAIEARAKPLRLPAKPRLRDLRIRVYRYRGTLLALVTGAPQVCEGGVFPPRFSLFFLPGAPHAGSPDPQLALDNLVWAAFPQ